MGPPEAPGHRDGALYHKCLLVLGQPDELADWFGTSRVRNVLLDLVQHLAVALLAETVALYGSHLAVQPAESAQLAVARTIADVAQLHRRLHVLLVLVLHVLGDCKHDRRGLVDHYGRLGDRNTDRPRPRARAVV
eukprot:2569634-Prymnesium_polylepis.1